MRSGTSRWAAGVLGILVSSLCVAAPPQLVGQVDVGDHPESAAGDAHYIYVSNMGPKMDLTESGDGYISRLSTDGEVLEAKYLPTSGTLNSPTGMFVQGDVLFVNDLSRVVGFDLKNRRQVVNADLSSFGVKFLNDITFVSASQAVVSATYDHKLYMVDFARRVVAELKVPAKLRHPNGLAWDEQRRVLYVGCNEESTIGATDANGTIHAFRLHRKVTAVGEQKNLGKFIDGLAFVHGAILATDWGGWGNDGKLIQISGASPYIVPLGLKGAADFHWFAPKRRLFIAQLSEGKVAMVDF